MAEGAFEHVLAVSDTHFGWDEANVSVFHQFLRQTVPQKDPDALFLCGDVLDMWRRGIASITVESAPLLDELEDLYEDGVDLYPIFGNHDQRLKRMDDTRQVVADRPWLWRGEVKFTSGGREFVATHGQQADPANANPARNEGLCMTSDEVAYAIAHNYDTAANGIATLQQMLFGDPILPRPTLGTLAFVSNPGLLSKPEYAGRAKRISRRLASMYSEFVIHGHTHVPGKGEGWANCGSWTRNRNTYIEIQDGNVEVIEYPSGEVIA